MTDRMKKSPDLIQGIVAGTCQPADIEAELLSLRPERLSEYVGQTEVVETLKIAIEAAKMRKEPLDHVLFHGPPGLGKTTLAHIIANEMGGNLTVTSGPALEKGGDLIGILTHLSRGDVLFVDEIHRMPKAVEEFLYPAMEDFAVDFVFDKGAHARSHRIPPGTVLSRWRHHTGRPAVFAFKGQVRDIQKPGFLSRNRPGHR